jgi:EF-hand domain/EF-hand domain pair
MAFSWVATSLNRAVRGSATGSGSKEKERSGPKMKPKAVAEPDKLVVLAEEKTVEGTTTEIAQPDRIEIAAESPARVHHSKKLQSPRAALSPLHNGSGSSNNTNNKAAGGSPVQELFPRRAAQQHAAVSSPIAVPKSPKVEGNKQRDSHASSNPFLSPPRSSAGRSPSSSAGRSPSSSPKTQRWGARWYTDQSGQRVEGSPSSARSSPQSHMFSPKRHSPHHVARSPLASPQRHLVVPDVVHEPDTADESHKAERRLENLFEEWLAVSDERRSRNATGSADGDGHKTPPPSSPGALSKLLVSPPHSASPRYWPPRSPSRLAEEEPSENASENQPLTPPLRDQGRDSRTPISKRSEDGTSVARDLSPRFQGTATQTQEEIIPRIQLRRGPRSGRRSGRALGKEVSRLRHTLNAQVPRERSDDGSHGLWFTKDELALALEEEFQWPRYLSFVLCVRLREIDTAEGWSAGKKKERRILVSMKALEQFWKDSVDTKSRAHTCFNVICGRRGANGERLDKDFLVYSDLYSLCRAIVHQHPDLEFLRSAEHAEFRERYCETVAIRAMYMVGRSKQRVTRARFLASDFADKLFALNGRDQVNECSKYFSYEHFYVIYVKFWALDTDHDLWVSGDELLRYGEETWSMGIVRRMLVDTPRYESSHHGTHVHFRDFVWLIFSEEDKTTETAIEFWFRLLDTDGDGVLSLYELEPFFTEQHQRLKEIDEEDTTTLPDSVCMLMDTVQPKHAPLIHLSDLKRCKHIEFVFNSLFSLRAMLEAEQLQPSDRNKYKLYCMGVPTPTPWQKFALEAYAVLSAEDSDSSDSESDSDDDWITH